MLSVLIPININVIDYTLDVWTALCLEPFPSKQRLSSTNPDLQGLKLPHETSP